MEMQLIIQDPKASPKLLASRLKAEPILATQLLKIAENIRKSRNPQNAPITSLEHAIVYIGFKSFSDLIVTASLRNFKIPASSFNVGAYWRDGLLTGSIAEHLARRFRLPLPEDQLFLAGTLCNVGKLVTATCFPPLIDKINRDVSDPRTLTTWRNSEQAYNFPSHSILGEIAAALWGFPDFVLQSARKHHDPFTSKGANLAIHEIVAVANQLNHWVLLQPHRIEAQILSDFSGRFSLSEKDMDQLAQELMPLKEKIVNKAAS
jgi:HD-like signal output (HDOD) protein